MKEPLGWMILEWVFEHILPWAVIALLLLLFRLITLLPFGDLL